MPLQIVYSDQLIGHHVHTHVHYEMLYVVEGAVSMTILGQEHLVQAGDLVFLNQFEEHATRLISEPYRRYYVLIPPRDLHAFHNDVELLSVFRFHGGHFPYVASAGARKGAVTSQLQPASRSSTEPLSCHSAMIFSES